MVIKWLYPIIRQLTNIPKMKIDFSSCQIPMKNVLGQIEQKQNVWFNIDQGTKGGGKKRQQKRFSYETKIYIKNIKKYYEAGSNPNVQNYVCNII